MSDTVALWCVMIYTDLGYIETGHAKHKKNVIFLPITPLSRKQHQTPPSHRFGGGGKDVWSCLVATGAFTSPLLALDRKRPPRIRPLCCGRGVSSHDSCRTSGELVFAAYGRLGELGENADPAPPLKNGVADVVEEGVT